MSGAIYTTLWIALMSPALAVALGWPLGLALARVIRRHRFIRVSLMVPLILSPVVTAYGWQRFFSEFGVSYGLPLVMVVSALASAPWVILQTAFSPVSTAALQVAQTLGARSSQRFSLILVPLSIRSMASAGLQASLWCLCSFTIVVALGGGPPVETLEVLIYQKLRSQWDPATAAVAAGLQLLLGVGATLAIGRFQATAVADTENVARANDFSEIVLALTVVGFFWIPVLSVSFSALSPELLAEASGPFLRSLVCAFVVAALSVMTALVIPRGLNRGWGLLTGLSPIAAGLLLWLVLGRIWDPFEGSLVPVILIQWAILGGIAARAVSDLRDSQPYDQVAAARTLGAKPGQVFRILEWPRMRAGILSSAGLVLAYALTDVSVSRVIGSTERPLFGSYLMDLAGQYRIDQAVALGSVGSLVGIVTLALGGRSR